MIELLLKVAALIYVDIFLFLRNKERKEFLEKENEIAELKRKVSKNF